jgi:hypothetical protein
MHLFCKTILVFILLIPEFLIAQDSSFVQKKIKSYKSQSKITIDGKLDESDWSLAESGKDFTAIQPVAGLPASQKTEFKVMYDDLGVYVGVICYDTHPDSLLTQLSQRDDVGNSEWVMMLFDTYRDGNNAFGIGVTINNVQIDARLSAAGQDDSWDAVWESKTKRTSFGWVAELRIPFSAIRFSSADIQNWNFNLLRDIRRNREEVWWNPLDPSMIRGGSPAGILARSGEITDLKHLKPPLRLMLYPYASTQIQPNGSGSLTKSVQGGADLKWGLNEAYTLDMTTIPDFRQVRFDNQVLNLSPYEVRFTEFRQFFTEGIDLFSKGDLFYSRRIGGRYYSVNASGRPNEKVVSNPTNNQLLNATKLSGRNAQGLGIGVLNAVTGNTYMEFLDTVTGKYRQALVSPLTNYSLIVFDQNLKNNSYISLISSQVIREGSAKDAQVVATQFRFNNKKNSYFVTGRFASSWQFYSWSTVQGIKTNASFGKNAGKFQWNYAYYYMDNRYNQNDLGYQSNNNVFNQAISFSSYQFKPTKIGNRITINRYNQSISLNYNRVVVPSEFAALAINYSFVGFTKKNMAFGTSAQINPIEGRDYFEPRTPGRFLYTPRSWNLNPWISTNYNNRLAWDLGFYADGWDQKGRNSFTFWINPRFRISSKTMIIPGISRDNLNNNVGFVGFYNNDVIIGRRKLITYESSLTVNHSFSSVMAINFRLRNYWSSAKYNGYFQIMDDGHWGSTSFNQNMDVSFTAFTIDWEFKWRFAPGSDLLLVYKNALFETNTPKNQDYFENLKYVIGVPHQHSINVKVQYFLDYQHVKKHLQRL